MHDALLKEFREAIKERYSIEREIGRGAYGTVFLAQDIALGRYVALKVLHVWLLPDAGHRTVLLHEFRVVARLVHPHILPVFDVGQAAGLAYYTTPFLEHVSLRKRIDQRPLGLTEALQIAREIADALTYAHAHHVVHRDIKPENVFLVEGKALVKDFWIARTLSRVAQENLTASGFVIGTPGYMSPEQARGVPQPDARSDVYSLAALICEMLTQQLPFAGSPADIVAQLSRDVSIKDLPHSLPPGLAFVLTKALAREPRDRFATPRELVDTCLAVELQPLTMLGSASPADSRSEFSATVFGDARVTGRKLTRDRPAPAQLPRRRDLLTRSRLAALIGVLIVLLGASVFWISKSLSTPPAPPPAPISLVVYLILSLALAVSVGALLLHRKTTDVQTIDVETTDV